MSLGGGTGRRTGLKIRSPLPDVRVRFPPQASIQPKQERRPLAEAVASRIRIPNNASFLARRSAPWRLIRREERAVERGASLLWRVVRRVPRAGIRATPTLPPR